jgi:hypothetical protein
MVDTPPRVNGSREFFCKTGFSGRHLHVNTLIETKGAGGLEAAIVCSEVWIVSREKSGRAGGAKRFSADEANANRADKQSIQENTMKRQPSFHWPRQFVANTSLLITRVSRHGRLRRAFALLAALLCAGTSARAQSGMSLPVYHVTQSGATAAQASQLASDLGIPASQLVYSNGLVSFIDPTNFLNIPTMPMTDQNAISNLLAETVNQSPDIPIQFEQIDFATLSNRTVLDDADATGIASFALNDAMLHPQFGNLFIGHGTILTMFNLPGGGVSSNSQFLDTQVNFHFTETNGYPLIGPGAQVQFAFDDHGNTTRFLYSARQLAPGPLVQIIPKAVALSRVANLFPAGTQLDADVEYYCPPFWWHWPFPCPCPPPPWEIQNILPYWVIHGSVPQTNPTGGEVVQMQTLTEMIPATDDPAFVPSVNLSASAGAAGGVFASADVTGGTPPYVYEWGGSASTPPSNNAASFSYNPIVRVVQPEVQVSRPSDSVAIVSWNSSAIPHPWPWILESTGALNGGSNNWTPVDSPVQSNNGVSSVTLSNVPAVQFFRLRLASTSLTTTDVVNVTVIDANGVSVRASQTLVVQATPVQLVPGSGGLPPSGPCQPQWGTESPVDPGLGTKDRTDWRARMMADPGAGNESFLWTINTAWMGDFLDPAVPHKLGISPDITGCDDYKNWGVDSADIVLYIGHGAPTAITFTATPPLFFNNPNLTRSWGDDADVGYHPVDWLCLLSCQVLSNNWAGLTAPQRWGNAFDGLHILTGFQSPAFAGTGFPATFADNMMLGAPQTIVKSWFNSAMMHGTGQAAAMGPIGFGGAIDFNDHYWCKGTVGPTIKQPLIIGWWFVSQ